MKSCDLLNDFFGYFLQGKDKNRPLAAMHIPPSELSTLTQQVVERLELLDDLLRSFGVVPEAGLSHLSGELVALRGLGGEVKESPVAGSVG